ncbi:hypothetical protein TNCV_1140951 [Trichonephila clavipes]|nr:hypothetical protein TNCV_1140951 [Trichonephila clavipes]
MCRVEVLQAWCVYKRTDGSVIVCSSAVRAVKQSVGECCVREVTRVEQHSCIEIAVLRRENAMEHHRELVEALGNNALPYRTVARWPYGYGHEIVVGGIAGLSLGTTVEPPFKEGPIYAKYLEAQCSFVGVVVRNGECQFKPRTRMMDIHFPVRYGDLQNFEAGVRYIIMNESFRVTSTFQRRQGKCRRRQTLWMLEDFPHR